MRQQETKTVDRIVNLCCSMRIKTIEGWLHYTWTLWHSLQGANQSSRKRSDAGGC